MQLSVVIITFNEEANIARTLASVQPLVADGNGEIIVVDSGSTDRTVEIAKSYSAKVFVEEWKGFAAQKDSAIDKATGDWLLSLDADEELESGTADAIHRLWLESVGSPQSQPRSSQLARDSDSLETVEVVMALEEQRQHKSTAQEPQATTDGYWLRRKNHFLGRWMRHGGYWPDPKLRLFRRGSGRFEDRAVHEDVKVEGHTGKLLGGALIHHSYPSLSDYIEHMNHYSSLGAEMVVAKGEVGFSFSNIVLRPLFTFIYNYFFRLGFLDGREGLLLHLYHAVYVSWKYSKAWELSRKRQ